MLPPRPVALHQATLDALLARHADFLARGIEVHQQLRAVMVRVDPLLLAPLLQAALQWASRPGCDLRVTLEMKNWPEHGLLTIRCRPRPVSGHEPAPPPPHDDDPSWLHLQQTAQALEVTLERTIDGATSKLTLEFPHTVSPRSGLTALEVERQAPDTGLAKQEGRRLIGLRVLLVTDDSRVERDVTRVCLGLDLRLDSVTTMAQAAMRCASWRPNLIIIDDHLHDEAFDQLHQQLVDQDGDFPVIEIASAAQGFAMSSWDEASTSRIGRDAIRHELPLALVAELGEAG